MVVSANEQAYVSRVAKGIRHVVPVIYISLHERIVGDHDGRHVAMRLQFLLCPCRDERRHMTVCHLEQRPGVEHQETNAIVCETVVFRPEDAAIACATRFAPGGLVIAHADVVGTVQSVEARLHLQHHPRVALFREVARHEDKVDAVGAVYLVDACQQRLGGAVAVGIEMDVGKLCEAEGFHFGHDGTADKACQEGDKEDSLHGN